jgi:hypothetical protein
MASCEARQDLRLASGDGIQAYWRTIRLMEHAILAGITDNSPPTNINREGRTAAAATQQRRPGRTTLHRQQRPLEREQLRSCVPDAADTVRPRNCLLVARQPRPPSAFWLLHLDGVAPSPDPAHPLGGSSRVNPTAIPSRSLRARRSRSFRQTGVEPGRGARAGGAAVVTDEELIGAAVGVQREQAARRPHAKRGSRNGDNNNASAEEPRRPRPIPPA